MIPKRKYIKVILVNVLQKSLFFAALEGDMTVYEDYVACLSSR